MELETRYLATALDLETRADGPSIVSGLASPVWDGQPGSEYPINDNISERFAAGAFDSWLSKNRDIPLILNHNASLPLDFPKVWVSKRGVEFKGELDDTSVGRDARILLSTGRIKGASIGFMSQNVAWSKEGNRHIRTVKQAELHEISLVYRPAYVSAAVSLREHALWLENEEWDLMAERVKQLLERLAK